MDHVYGDDHEPEKDVSFNHDSKMWNVKVNGAHVGSTWSEEDGHILADWWIQQVYKSQSPERGF